MFFSIVFGAALTLVSRESAAPVIALLDGVFKVVAKVIDIVMKIAPLGVACLLFAMTARFGFGFLVSLGWYVVTVLGGLAFHLFVVCGAALKFGARVSPVEFFRRTYLTESLKRLLVGAVNRLGGYGGDPVVQLQTNFGGGRFCW